MKLLIGLSLILLLVGKSGEELCPFPLPPPPKTLIQPQNMEIVTFDSPKLIFSWTSSGDEYEYLFELSSSRNFQNLEYDLRCQLPELKGIRLTPGTWYWRVSSRDKNGLIGKPTKSGMFIYSPFGKGR